MSLKKEKEDNKKGAPAYIVTFSDMITLLLTFFVMLLSLAQEQDAELFYKGQQSFIQSLEELGIGALANRQGKTQIGSTMVRYDIENPDDATVVRTLDARKEKLRRLFQQLEQKTQSRPSNIKADKMQFSVTPLRFAPGQSNLSEADRDYLDDFCQTLEQSTVGQRLEIYVLGISPEQTNPQKQWILSARRAESTAGYLRSKLDIQNLSVYSWGAGPGGEWTDRNSPISENCRILIAVLRQNSSRM